VSRLLPSLLVSFALLGVPGCGPGRSIVKDAIARVAGPGLAARWLGGSEAGPEQRSATRAPAASTGNGSSARVERPEPAGEPAPPGFYRIVEPNGTVRFVSNLSEVPVEQRAGAERLALEPRQARSARRAAPRPTARPTALAEAAPPAAPAPASRAANALRAPSAGHEVVIYTTSWCPWCKRTRAWLDAKGIEYVEKDIERNEEWAHEMRALTGSGSVPVVVIDGVVIRGFNQAKMEALLRS
jgi:glutaredoxin-like YruB-family protein